MGKPWNAGNATSETMPYSWTTSSSFDCASESSLISECSFLQWPRSANGAYAELQNIHMRTLKIIWIWQLMESKKRLEWRCVSWVFASIEVSYGTDLKLSEGKLLNEMTNLQYP
jgi:hypothetical protein